MPVPGPRNQFGPDGGYRNPTGEQPDRFNHWKRPGPIFWPGRSPGLMQLSLRGCILGFGQIRHMYRQSVNMVAAQDDFSWSANGQNLGGHHPAVGVTRALRYMTRSVYMGAGIDNSRYYGIHTQVTKQNVYKTVTVGAGNKSRNRPTVRNRMTSFGSRVPPINQSVPAAESQNPGGATQA